MRSTERRIYYFDIEVKRRGNETHLPPLASLLDVWKERSDDGSAFQERSSGDLVYNIDAAEHYDDDEMAHLLLSVTDRNSPEAVYADLKTGEAVVHRKKETQGGMHSAHLLISRVPCRADTYHCVIEGAVKLSSTNIELLLNRILHDEYTANKTRFTYADPMGRKTRKGDVRRTPFLPRVELKGHPSPELLADLAGGKVKDLHLVSTVEKEDFADNPFLVETRHQLTIDVKPGLPREDRWGLLTRAAQIQAGSYAKARVRFTDVNNNPKHIDFNTSDGAVIDGRYVRHELIAGIVPPLADGTEEIVSRVVRPMMRMIRAQRGDQQ